MSRGIMRSTENKRISVGLFCRVLPQYRLAIYERLAKADGIDLMVYYSREPKYYSLRTVDPAGRFPHQRIEMKAIRLGNQELLFQPEIKKIVASGRHDVVILSANPRLLSNFPALWAAKRSKVGVVWWSLGIMPNQSRITLNVRRVLMKIPDALVFYTQAEKDFFVSHGVSPEKVFVAQNTVCVNQERAAAAQWSHEDIAAFQQNNGFYGKKVLLFCGQLREKKRVDWLLSALRTIRQNGYDYLLFLIGPDNTQGQAARLASDLDLDDSVRFLGPIYGAEHLAPWFLSARALVVPRAIGLAALHGFAFNLPCITSRDRRYQTPEATALRDGYNCLLYEDGSIHDMAVKIIKLGEDDAVHRSLCANARRTMEEEYTVDRMVDGFVQAIHYAKACVSR